MKPLLVLCFPWLMILAACGGDTDQCFTTSINVTPASAIINHSAAPPANAQQFVAFEQATGGCFTAQSSSARVTWSVSDTAHVTISNAQDTTYGAATCTAATAGPVTVTATLPADANKGHAASGTAQLTCN